MNIQIEDFKTGWYGISIGIKPAEIAQLINQLTLLGNSPQQHFHIASKFEGVGGIADVEFYVQEDESDNMLITGIAIDPNR